MASYAMQERPQREMAQKARLHDAFFGLKNPGPRPESVMTEFMDMDCLDWDQASVDIVSDNEEENSPRHSLNSSGQRSVTTISSYDEVQTPRSTRNQSFYGFDGMAVPVEGPRGPHLFRSSQQSNSSEYEHVLSLSPMTPKVPRPLEADFPFELVHDPMPALAPVQQQQQPRQSRAESPFQYTSAELDTSRLVSWTPRQVAQWMLNANIEAPVADKFVENDINGGILMTLKFEDLKELNIPSFGVRTKVWEQVHILRGSRSSSPRPPTPIEDAPSREVKKELKGSSGSLRRKKSKRSGSRKPSHEDIISPLESVSIVGIEQLLPKPHHCSKGENCAKYRRNQRLIEAFKKDHPFGEIESGTIMIAGDPGNPETAEAIHCELPRRGRSVTRRRGSSAHRSRQASRNDTFREPRIVEPPRNESQYEARYESRHSDKLEPPQQSDSEFRPVSDAVPSIVASSDILGPGEMPPLQYLKEAALSRVAVRDPQDNVRQFLDFQVSAQENTVPPTPPFEMPGVTPTIQQPTSPANHNLRRLPKLSIPAQQDRSSSSSMQQQQQNPGGLFVPYRMEKADPISPDLATPMNPYRFGTPFSEMDVPVTAVPVGPISRDLTQSVPPDMNYNAPVMLNSGLNRSSSRLYSRRPSVPVLPAVEENASTPRASRAPSSIAATLAAAVAPVLPSSVSKSLAPTKATKDAEEPKESSGNKKEHKIAVPPANRPLQPPPRSAYPWSSRAPAHAADDGTTFEGPMRKRKTRMLRHEWQEAYFTLKGTRLAMHPDAESSRTQTLEYVDIDDYAIACSSLGSSKLNAAFRAVNFFARDGGKERRTNDPLGAFSFQLIPQEKANGTGMRLKKRESNNSAKSTSQHHHQNSQDSSTTGSSAVSSTTSLTSASLTSASSSSSATPHQEGINTTGKTHHFAVRNREERIDWMRELMLAKALKQKTAGFEVSVNGNMI